MRVIVIPGHGKNTEGGFDPGAIGVTGVGEHTEATRIVAKMQHHLTLAGHDCMVVHRMLSLPEKVELANGWNPDLGIEVHFNSHSTPQAHGTEVLHYGESTRAQAAAMSRLIAKAIDTTDRGAKERPDLFWLRKTAFPALLVETLFLSNPQEERKTANPEFPSAVAAAIVSALKSAAG